MRMSFHEPGSTVALRWVYRGKLWGGRAVTVVSDGPERTFLSWGPGCEWWSAHGTGRHPVGRRWDLVQTGRWDLLERPWTRSRALLVLEPGRYYGICLFWEADTGEFRNFYVNFQLPFRRSHAGFDSLDLDLDLVVERDLSWRWKDEEDWSAAKASGALDDATIAGVEAGREEALKRVQAGLRDLTDWVDWVPDPSWAPPRMPGDWDRL